MANKDDNKPRDIYLLICPIENIVRYVGISIKPTNRFSTHLTPSQEKESPHKFRWIQKIKKEGFKPTLKVIAENVEKKEACHREKELIAYYRSILGDKLTNIHEGGGIPPNSKGKTLSKETKEKISKAHKNKIVSLEVIEKLKNNALKFRKKVIQYTDDGIKINDFDSLKKAAKFVGVHSANISLACRGKIKRVGGFIWRFEGDSFNKFETKLILPGSNQLVKIKQFDIQGNLISVYESVIEASKSLNCHAANISAVLRGKKKKAKGFIWTYFNESFEEKMAFYANVKDKRSSEEYALKRSVIQKNNWKNPDYRTNQSIKQKEKWKNSDYKKLQSLKHSVPRPHRVKKIVQLSLDDNFIKIHENIHLAAAETNSSFSSIRSVICGKRNSCNGFKWRNL